VKVVDLREVRLERDVEARPAIALLQAKFVQNDEGDIVATLWLFTDPTVIASPGTFAIQHFRSVAALLLRLADAEEAA
jgi:hypothetical protein